jgi:hypothetical protein
MTMLLAGEQHGGLDGGGVGGVQHGGGVQPHEGGGDGGVQQLPAKAAAGTAAIISQRPMPAISAIKWVLLAIDWLSWSTAQVCKQETRRIVPFWRVSGLARRFLQPSCDGRFYWGGRGRRAEGRSAMFHLNTELLIDYWRARRGERRLPARSEIDPAAFAALLPQTFIVVREEDGAFRFRLAGETINDLHGRGGLRGQAVAMLWRPDHRRHLTGVLEAALRTAEPVVIDAEAAGEGPARRLEVLFAPLAGPGGLADRFLGLYQTTSPHARSAKGPIGELAIRALNGAQAAPAPPKLRLAVVDGRRIA